MMPEDKQKQLHNLLRGSLSPFIQKAFHEVNPGQPFFDSWYLDAMAHKLEQCRVRDCKRLIITFAAANAEVDRGLSRVSSISSRS